MFDVSTHAGDELRRHSDALAEAIVARQYSRQPKLWEPYGDRGRDIAVRDALYHLDMLADATSVNESALFVDYISWAKVLFHHLGLPDEGLSGTLRCTYELIEQSLEPEHASVLLPIIKEAMDYLPLAPKSVDPFVSEDHPHGQLARRYLDELLRGDRTAAGFVIGEALSAGVIVEDIYLHVFQPCQWEIGRLWQMNQVSVAEEHYCTAATQLIMSQLYGHIFSTQKGQHRLVSACVGDEMHELGARMVADIFELHGWDTHYLGANVPTEAMLSTLDRYSPDVVAISTTLVSHLNRTRELVARIRESKHGRTTRIMLGGRPFMTAPGLCSRMGADICEIDALTALKKAHGILGIE